MSEDRSKINPEWVSAPYRMSVMTLTGNYHYQDGKWFKIDLDPNDNAVIGKEVTKVQVFSGMNFTK